jgi:hypothetical protein
MSETYFAAIQSLDYHAESRKTLIYSRRFLHASRIVASHLDEPHARVSDHHHRRQRIHLVVFGSC